MQYELTWRSTAGAVGFFSTQPVEQLALPEAARYLVAHPFDQFMRRFLLEGVECLEPDELGGLIAGNLHAPRPFLAVLYEACIMEPRFRPLTGRFQGLGPEDLAGETALVYIRSEQLPDHLEQRPWIEAFRANRERHEPLPANPAAIDDELPVSEALLAQARARQWVHVGEVLAQGDARAAGREPARPRPPAAETYARAMERLESLEVLTEQEMRHESSLSPIGLLRRWKLDRTVQNGRHDFRLTGVQTSWGKGLTLDAARASLAMEMVERVSSFASVGPDGLVGFANAMPLIQADLAERQGAGAALEPNRMRLDVPYTGQPLWWLKAQDALGRAVSVPAQFVFLFSNFDEPSFFSGLSSTGLASGNTLVEARLAALLECVERDAEGVHLYRPQDCFLLAADDPELAALLERYRQAGIQPVLQDITPEYGVPAYKAFVQAEDGTVAKGCGANLDGRKAALSALLEVPFAFPLTEETPAPRPAPEGLPTRRWEDLPNYSASDFGRDLARLECVLEANGHAPLYVDLTHAQVGLPVAKALAPGLELTADLDRFARVSPRLLLRYMK